MTFYTLTGEGLSNNSSIATIIYINRKSQCLNHDPSCIIKLKIPSSFPLPSFPHFLCARIDNIVIPAKVEFLQLKFVIIGAACSRSAIGTPCSNFCNHEYKTSMVGWRYEPRKQWVEEKYLNHGANPPLAEGV